MLEKEIKGMASIDIYNCMMAQPKREDYKTMAHVLKERWEIDFLYSLLINKH